MPVARRGSELPPLPPSAEVARVLMEFLSRYSPTIREMQIITADHFGYATSEITTPLVRGTSMRFMTRFSRALDFLIREGLIEVKTSKLITLTELGTLQCQHTDRMEIPDLDKKDDLRKPPPALPVEAMPEPSDAAVPAIVETDPDTERRAADPLDELIARMPSMSLGKLHVLWQNATSIASGADAGKARQAEHVLAHIEAERRRRAIANENEESFEWPGTEPLETGNASKSAKPAKGASGILASFGYHVGLRKGLPQFQRRAVLNEICDLPALAKLPTEWGEADSSRRIKALSHAIAYCARRAKADVTRNHGMAVSEWEDDLSWLKETRYDGRFSFHWPETTSSPEDDDAFRQPFTR